MPANAEKTQLFYSITIPTLNCNASILKTLRSIHSQSQDDTEVIIADGGSTDGTQDKAIRFFVDHQINGRILAGNGNNIYQSLNQTLKAATGQWIITLGSGDCFYEANTLSKARPILEKSQAGAVHGDTYVEATGETWGGNFDKKRILVENICHQSIFYRASFLKRNHLYYNPAYSICADWDFNLKLYAMTRIDYAPIYIARYEGNGLSSTSRGDAFRHDRIKRIIEYHGMLGISLLPIHELTPNIATIPTWMHPLVWSKRIFLAPWRLSKKR